MAEKKEKKKEDEKKKRKQRKGISNVEPVEEPVKGPTGDDIYRV
jgi:hypothetical protein